MVEKLILNASIPKTKEEYVTESLRENILMGHLQPGERLDQDEIASRFNVSRSPIRSALRTLSAEGLVEISPHYSTSITQLSPATVHEIFQIREMIEGYAAKVAAPKMTVDHLRAIKSILDELAKTTDPHMWLNLNRAYHLSIYQASVSPHLLWIIENLRNITSLYSRAHRPSDFMEISKADHERIFNACVNRDGITAQMETEKHVERVGHQTVKFMSL